MFLICSTICLSFSRRSQAETIHTFAASPTPAGAFTVRGLPATETPWSRSWAWTWTSRTAFNLTIDWVRPLSSDINANALAATLNWRFQGREH